MENTFDAKNIKVMRAIEGLSQTRFGELTRLSQRRVSDIERGIPPTREETRRINRIITKAAMRPGMSDDYKMAANVVLRKCIWEQIEKGTPAYHSACCNSLLKYIQVASYKYCPYCSRPILIIRMEDSDEVGDDS